MATYTKSELARLYNVSPKTFTRWLRPVAPQMPGYRRNQRIFTPLQVKFLIEHLGPPD